MQNKVIPSIHILFFTKTLPFSLLLSALITNQQYPSPFLFWISSPLNLTYFRMLDASLEMEKTFWKLQTHRSPLTVTQHHKGLYDSKRITHTQRSMQNSGLAQVFISKENFQHKLLLKAKHCIKTKYIWD